MEKTEFIIVKNKYRFRTCNACEGSGRKKHSFRSMVFAKDCPVCLGEGRIKMTTTEEVPLVEALRELSIIK